MALVSQSVAVVVLAVAGAFVQAAVTFRLYEPPPPDDAPEAEPTPVLEAVMFGGVFGLLFWGAGVGLGAVEGVSPPLGPVIVALAAGIGAYSALATATGRMGGAEDAAVRALGIVTGTVVGALGAVVLVL